MDILSRSDFTSGWVYAGVPPTLGGGHDEYSGATADGGVSRLFKVHRPSSPPLLSSVVRRGSDAVFKPREVSNPSEVHHATSSSCPSSWATIRTRSVPPEVRAARRQGHTHCHRPGGVVGP